MQNQSAGAPARIQGHVSLPSGLCKTWQSPQSWCQDVGGLFKSLRNSSSGLEWVLDYLCQSGVESWTGSTSAMSHFHLSNDGSPIQTISERREKSLGKISDSSSKDLASVQQPARTWLRSAGWSDLVESTCLQSPQLHHINFLIQAVWDVLTNLFGWKKVETLSCPLCLAQGTLDNIMSSCPVILSNGWYTGQHNQVLKSIPEAISKGISRDPSHCPWLVTLCEPEKTAKIFSADF